MDVPKSIQSLLKLDCQCSVDDNIKLKIIENWSQKSKERGNQFEMVETSGLFSFIKQLSVLKEKKRQKIIINVK